VSRSKKRKIRKKEGSDGQSATLERCWRRHPIGVQQQAVRRMELGESPSALAQELGVHRNSLYYWRTQRMAAGEQAGTGQAGDAGASKVRELETRIVGLEGALGRKTLELDFFVSALRRVAAPRQNSSATGGTACTEKSADARKRRKAD
jgi:transposase-like protein